MCVLRTGLYSSMDPALWRIALRRQQRLQRASRPADSSVASSHRLRYQCVFSSTFFFCSLVPIGPKVEVFLLRYRSSWIYFVRRQTSAQILWGEFFLFFCSFVTSRGMNQLENSRWNGTDDYLNFLVENCSALLSNRSEFDDGSSNSSLESEENPSYFSRDYRIVGTFFQGLILLVGVLGNLLVVLVHIHASLCSNRNIVHSRPEKAPSFSSCPYFRQHLISLSLSFMFKRLFIELVPCIHLPTVTWWAWRLPIASSSSLPFPTRSSPTTSSAVNGFGDPSDAPFSSFSKISVLWKSLQTSARDPSSRSSGTRPKSMLIRALCLIRRDQRVVAEFDGVHSRALHRHLSPDEGPERLHGQARQEDRRRRLGIRFLLLVALARPHRHRAHPLQGIPDGRALRNEIIPSRVLGIISK